MMELESGLNAVESQLHILQCLRGAASGETPVVPPPPHGREPLVAGSDNAARLVEMQRRLEAFKGSISAAETDEEPFTPCGARPAATPVPPPVRRPPAAPATPRGTPCRRPGELAASDACRPVATPRRAKPAGVALLQLAGQGSAAPRRGAATSAPPSRGGAASSTPPSRGGEAEGSQDLRAEVGAERRRFIESRLAAERGASERGAEAPPRSAPAAQGATSDLAGEDVDDEVPTIEELRSRAQQEREAYISRRLAAEAADLNRAAAT